MMDCCLWVVCLMALITAAQACCEPTSYTFAYAGTVSGIVPDGPTREMKIEGNYIASGVIDYLNSNARQAFSGIVTIPYGDNKIPVPFSVDIGISEGKTLWIKAESPATGPARCMAWNIKGGIPKDYQCITDNYKEISENTYEAPNQNDMVRESITVTDECIVRTANMSINIPNGPNIKMTARLAEYDLSIDSFVNPDMPDDCQIADEELELPKLDENSPGWTALLTNGVQGMNKKRRSFSKRTLINEGLKRLARHIKEAVKRAQ